MRVTRIVLLAATAATVASAPLLNPDSAFNITALVATGYASDMTAMNLPNVLNFTVQDPDPRTNAQTTCRLQWDTTTQPPTQYSFCDDVAWQVRIGDNNGAVSVWTGPSIFGLSLTHAYQDDSLGSPPNNWRQTFARGNVTTKSLDCTNEAPTAAGNLRNIGLIGPNGGIASTLPKTKQSASGGKARQVCQLRSGVAIEMPVWGVSG